MNDLDIKFSEFSNLTMTYVDAIDELIKFLEKEKAAAIASWELIAKRQHMINAKNNANG